MSRVDKAAATKSKQPPMPAPPKRQVFLMPTNMLDEDVTFTDPTHQANATEAPTDSILASKAIKRNARRNYGVHSCNTTLMPRSSKHSRAWLYRRFYEPIELQVETLSALVARGMFVIWYLTLVAALVLSVIPEAQWTIKNVCDLSSSAPKENLKHLDRWQTTCMTVAAASSPTAVPGTFDVTWTGSGYDGNRHGLDRFRRLVLSLPTPVGMTSAKKTYHLTARVETIELTETVSVFYDIDVVCRRGKKRCDVQRLPGELLMADGDGSPLTLSLVNLPAELAAPLSPTVTGQPAVTQSLASVGIAFQKKSYSLGTIVWRYIFMFLTLMHFIRFLANRKYTSSLYEQSWVLLLQLALFWYMDPLIALNVTMHPVPSVLTFVEMRLPTYFFAITMAFMFAVMTASMTWKQRSEEPAASYLRKRMLLSKNVYAPPNWTKLVAGLFVAAVFVLDIVDASVYQEDWISGSNATSATSPIYWTVIALLLFGAAVCMVLLYYLRGYLGSKPYLESRPQQLACRVFLNIFLSTVVFYVIHCFVFFLHYNRSYGAAYARQPFIQFPALLVAPILVNIMTLVYTTRNRNESVPVLASDARWMAMVWPDSWYRWLARHGGSQYIFNSEEEETSFYRLQFQFRCRQLMAQMKKKQQGQSRRERRRHGHAYSEDDLASHRNSAITDRDTNAHPATHNNSFGSFALSALPSFVLDGLRSPEGGQTLRTDLSAASVAGVPGRTHDGAASQPPRPGFDDEHDPSLYQTPPPNDHHRTNSAHSAARSTHAWGVPQDPLARTNNSSTQVGSGAGVGVLPGKMGRKLLNMDRFSTYYLPPERTTERKSGSPASRHLDPLAQTYGGQCAGPSRPSTNASPDETLLANTTRGGVGGPAPRPRRGMPSDVPTTRSDGRAPQASPSAGVAVVGPARHRSMLQQRAAAAAAASHAPSRNRSFAATATADPLAVTSSELLLRSPDVAPSADASASPAPSPVTTRWGSAINATIFLNALHQPPVGRRPSGSDEDDEGDDAAHTVPPDDGHAQAALAHHDAHRTAAALDEPVLIDDHLDNGGDDDTVGAAGRRPRAASAPDVEYLRSYEIQFAHSSDDDSDDWWQGAAAHGGAVKDRNVGFFRGIANALGSAVQTAEWHLIVNPARQLERLQDAALDAAYRPFDATTYLPFFNLETAIDCYNMSWEAYGVKESAGDAPIETGLKLAPENVPATVKHGVSKVLCGCCAATESDEDSPHEGGAGEDNASQASGDDDHGEQRFPEDIPESEDPEARKRKAKKSGTEEQQKGSQEKPASPSSPQPAQPPASSASAVTTSVPVAAPAEAEGKEVAPPTVYPINVGKYGFELLFVTEIRDVQLLIVKMNTDEPEHRGKAPRLIISFRGTANLSNAKYDVNLHRVVWKEMERAEMEDEMRTQGAPTSIASTAASSIAAYTGCKACWKSCVRRSSWRPTVHAGFLSLWKSMQSTVLREVKKALVADASCVYRLFTTGHSLGGALAALAAYSITRMLLRLDYPIPEVTSYTYGQPRIGNRTFRNAYDKAVPRSFRIMNESDMVVTMTTFGGYHVGIEVDVDRNGNFIVKPTEIEKMFPPTQGRGLAVMNHLMSNYGISMNAIAKARRCPARALMTYETADPEKRRREKLNDRKLNLYPPSEAEEDYPDEPPAEATV